MVFDLQGKYIIYIEREGPFSTKPFCLVFSFVGQKGSTYACQNLDAHGLCDLHYQLYNCVSSGE